MGGLFDTPEAAPAPTPPPIVEPESPIPIRDDAAAARSRRKALARRKKTGGRQSTILTSTDRLGG